MQLLTPISFGDPGKLSGSQLQLIYFLEQDTLKDTLHFGVVTEPPGRAVLPFLGALCTPGVR